MLHSLAYLCELDDEVKDEVAGHLSTLYSEFKSYFPELDQNLLSIVRNPFLFLLNRWMMSCKIDLKNDLGCRDQFETYSFTEFWIRVSSSYPRISRNCFKKLLPCSTTWLSESAFTSLLDVKSKQCNRLDIEDVIRCALSSPAPRIQSIVDMMQRQSSH